MPVTTEFQDEQQQIMNMDIVSTIATTNSSFTTPIITTTTTFISPFLISNIGTSETEMQSYHHHHHHSNSNTDTTKSNKGLYIEDERQTKIIKGENYYQQWMTAVTLNARALLMVTILYKSLYKFTLNIGICICIRIFIYSALYPFL